MDSAHSLSIVHRQHMEPLLCESLPRSLSEKKLWPLADKSKFEKLAVRISCTACGHAGNDDAKWRVREQYWHMAYANRD